MLTPSLIQKALAASNLEQFNFKEGVVAGDECVLVTPKELGVDWNRDNLILRSCLYRKSDYYPISLSHIKFANLGEKPEVFPQPPTYLPPDARAENKMDGSLIIVSRYKDVSVIRTRGTFDAFDHLETRDELKALFAAYPRILDNDYYNSGNFSLLFEHTSLVRPIVVRYPKSELTLLGIIRHYDYRYMPAHAVDVLAHQIGVPRPEVFSFNSVNDIIKTCEALSGKEGFVLSWNDFNSRTKIKAAWYLLRHRMKSALSSFNSILDLWVEQGGPNYWEFESYITKTFDFELVEQTKQHRIDLSNSLVWILSDLADIDAFVAPLRTLPRREAAEKIKETYKGDAEMMGCAFASLSGKSLSNRDLAKMVISRRRAASITVRQQESPSL